MCRGHISALGVFKIFINLCIPFFDSNLFFFSSFFYSIWFPLWEKEDKEAVEERSILFGVMEFNCWHRERESIQSILQRLLWKRKVNFFYVLFFLIGSCQNCRIRSKTQFFNYDSTWVLNTCFCDFPDKNGWIRRTYESTRCV